jgi:hypothetical protein
MRIRSVGGRRSNAAMRYPLRVLGNARKEIGAVVRADSGVHGRLRDRVAAVVFATIGVDLICAVLAYMFERNAAGTDIHSFGTAIFWTTTQLLTVSSQVSNPHTTAGRLLDVFMELWALVVVSSLAGSLGAFFVHRGGAPAGTS